MQIRCGDLYSDAAISTFNACAVSDKKCVPQRIDSGQGAQVPTEEKLSKDFDLNNFQVRQMHEYSAPEACEVLAPSP